MIDYGLFFSRDGQVLRLPHNPEISIHAPREGSDSNISQKEHAAFVRLRDIAQNSV